MSLDPLKLAATFQIKDTERQSHFFFRRSFSLAKTCSQGRCLLLWVHPRWKKTRPYIRDTRCFSQVNFSGY